MRRTLALLALASLGTGCCTQTDHLAFTGLDSPVGTGLVLALAEEACGRPLLGSIDWTSEGKGNQIGECDWGGGCPLDAWVEIGQQADGVPWDASRTALAHEIGHWCLASGDEARVAAWALAINVEARRQMAAAR